MQLPHGWTTQYALQWCVDRLMKQQDDTDLRNFVSKLTERVVELEKEVQRLELEKAGKRGRKPTAQG